MEDLTMRMRKYYKSRKEAIKAAEEHNKLYGERYGVFKMPKGSRKVGWYAVCSELEYLNTY